MGLLCPGGGGVGGGGDGGGGVGGGFFSMHKFLAALSSSRSLVVRPFVRPSEDLCEIVIFRVLNE